MIRRGVVLVELLVAIVVAGVLVVAVLGVQGSLERTSRSRAERAGAVANLRTVEGVFAFEMGNLGRDSVAGSDLSALGLSAVSYRAHRGLWIVCRLTADSVVLDSGRLGSWRARGLVPGRDSLLIYAPGDTAMEVNGWLPVPLLSGPSTATCSGGGPGDVFQTVVDTVTMATLRLAAPTVARGFETIALGVYGSGGTWQLGATSLSGGGSVQPVAGPLAPAGGISLTGWDRLGNPTSRLDSVAGVDLVVRALARREVAVGPGRAAQARDSLWARILFEGWP